MFHSFQLLSLFVILLSFVCGGHSRHIHGRRDATISASSAPSTPSSDSEATELLGDVTAIEDGLSSLPSDIISFIEDVDDRLHQQEALLESLLSVLGAPADTSSTTALTLPSETQSAAFSILTIGDTTTSSSDVSSCRHGGAGPLVPCTTSHSMLSESSSHGKPIRSSYVHVTHTVAPIPFHNTTHYGTGPSPTSPASTSMLPGPLVSSVTTPAFAPNEPHGNTSTNSETTTIPSASSAINTGYTFKTDRESNVAVYYGQTPTTKTGDLLSLCQNPNVDIVVLAFVTSFFTPSGFPTASFGPSCKGSTTAQQLHAPGLQDCTSLAPEIASCQSLGKPVLVSLGGYLSNVSFTSDTAATQLATNLWNLFGAGDGLDVALRPFGADITIDGFDLDNESGDATSYTTFATALRTLFASDTTKRYYLSSAPQCPRPDTSLPLATLALCDFVFVQFYNNPTCDLDTAGFQQSFEAWSTDLARVSNATRLYIGAPAFEAAGTGYVVGSALAHTVSFVRELYVGNFGGVMLWDGSEALGNVDGYGDDYLVYAKAALE